MENVYKQFGFENRREYLESLSEEYNVPLSTVFAMASMLGKNEDFDGLVTGIQDMAEW